MALPLTTINAQAAFAEFQNRGANVKNMCAQVSGPASIPANMLASLLSQVNNLLSYAQAIAADAAMTSAIVAYVQQISGSTTVQADFSASLAALQALQTAIIKDYPVDVSGHVLDRSIDASGNINWISFAPAQLPNTIPAITSWLATVQ